MKSITLITCSVIIALSLTAFTISSWNDLPSSKSCNQSTEEIEPPTFVYNLSPHGNNTITKERMHNAKTIADLIPDFSIQENLKNNILSVRDLKIRIEEENILQTERKSEKRNGSGLSKEQINFLKSTDYSNNFILEGFLISNDLAKTYMKERYFSYYMSVVPEKQASYEAGNKALVNFLTTNCQATIAKVQKGNLKSGSISFIVSKEGSISSIGINSTCGYPSVDKKMVELINQLPDGWNVATNGNGEKVNQTLVFSYGQGGC